MSDYEVEYMPMLQTAFNFLHRKQKKANGSALNQATQDFVFSHGGQCLHCGIALNRKNSNTEHIHDLALGGKNCKENKIIMCKSCNTARNATMQEYLGLPSYWRGFPGNWDRIKNYLLWNAVTVDKGHNRGNDFPEVHRIFEYHLNQNSNVNSVPSYWFGRGELPEIIHPKNTNNGGLFVKLFDWIFGYKPPTQGGVNDMVFQEACEKPLQSSQITNSERKCSYPDVPDEFRFHILNVLRGIGEEVKIATFSNIFKAYLNENEIQSHSLRDFTYSFGIPKRRTFVEIAEYYFPDSISCRLENKETFISYNYNEEE